MRQRTALSLPGIVEQRTGGAQRHRQIVAAETGQIVGTEMPSQRAARTVAVELPWVQFAARHGQIIQHRQRDIVRQQDFRRANAIQLRQQLFSLRLQHTERTGRQRQPGQAQFTAMQIQRQQQVIAPLVEQCGIGQGAGRDHPHHLALHRALAGGRIADLLADCHRLAKLHQPRQIPFG